jgi:RNA ligase (TIGR02306 family)
MSSVPLATLEHVKNCIKHPNAHSLSIITILGWKLITGLNDYRDGELIVYIRPDSILPDSLIEKLKLDYLSKGSRLKTIRLRGYISQGLALPIKIIPEHYRVVGADISEYLDIKKWEPPLPSYQKGSHMRPKRYCHPDFSKYIKIQNIKNYNNVFKSEDIVHISEKIHGTNTRYGNLKLVKAKGFLNFFKYCFKKFIGQKYQFVYGSHNVQLSDTNGKVFYESNVYDLIAKKYNLKNIIPKNTILYGEIYGSSIQGKYNYGLKNIDVFFYDAKVNGKYLNVSSFYQLIAELDLPYSETLYHGLYKYVNINDYKCGPSVLYPGHKNREGCVMKSVIEENDMKIGRKILKCINEKYLLEKDGTDFH